ncbi:MAG: hypothetical protein AAFU67_14140 [Bacteroidota bacterium]
MLRQSTKLTVIGFLLLFLGAFSLLLNMVGVDLIIFRWLYDLGGMVSTIVRILMIVVGFALVYIGNTNWEQEEI